MRLVGKTGIGGPLVTIAVIGMIVVAFGAYALVESSMTKAPAQTTASPSPSTSTTSSISSTSTTDSSTESQSSSSSSTITTSTSSSATTLGSSTSVSTSTSLSAESTSSSSTTASCSEGSLELIPTAFSNQSSSPNLLHLFGNYSSMEVAFSEVSNGTDFVSQTFTSYTTNVEGTESATESYSVVYASPTTYKVDVLENQSGTTFTATAWVQRNGDVIAYDYLGQNVTGSEAGALLEGLMSPFFYQGEYTTLVQTLTTAGVTQVPGHGQAQVGTESLATTNYTAPSLPLVVPICSGSLTLDTFSMQIGTAQGTSLQVLTVLTLSGSETYLGQTNQIISLVVRLVSVSTA